MKEEKRDAGGEYIGWIKNTRGEDQERTARKMEEEIELKKEEGIRE